MVEQAISPGSARPKAKVKAKALKARLETKEEPKDGRILGAKELEALMGMDQYGQERAAVKDHVLGVATSAVEVTSWPTALTTKVKGKEEKDSDPLKNFLQMDGGRCERSPA